jgi:hypothetical protein
MNSDNTYSSSDAQLFTVLHSPVLSKTCSSSLLEPRFVCVVILKKYE